MKNVFQALIFRYSVFTACFLYCIWKPRVLFHVYERQVFGNIHFSVRLLICISPVDYKSVFVDLCLYILRTQRTNVYSDEDWTPV